LRTELETLSKSLNKCTTDSGKAAADKQRVEAAIAALQTRRDQLALDAQRAQDDLTTAQTKLATARQEAETAQTKLTEEEQGVQTLTSQIAEVRKSISGINKKAAALLRSAARDNAEAADLEADALLQVFVSGDSNSQSSGSAPAEPLTFEEYVARLDALITTLRNHLHAMKAVATEIAAKKVEFDAKDEALKASMTTAQQEADRKIADVIAEIERLNAQLLQSNQAIRTALHNKRLAEDAVAAAITAIRESIAAVQENRRSLNADISRIQAQITQITTDLSSCMDSNSELQSAVAALEGKLQTDTADLDAIAKKQDQEIEAINQQIADANRARDSTTRQTSDLRDQEAALKAQRLTLTGELSTAESDMTDAKANHAAARRTRKQAGDRLDAAASIE